ncbi:MAG TPA: nuclear transport factor 2 family protein [Ktedonobacteraceae bacterium]|jgi:ketosteroid isomerase-like protein|nr:nuclear transport factor 2 family protein [Ktedonobacteraceae bacterium]
MDKHIIERIRNAYGAFSRGDIQGIVDAVDLDANALWIEPEEFYAGGIYRGRQEIMKYYTLSYESSEEVQSVPEEIIEIDDKIFVLVHFRAVPRGGGEPREGRIVDVFTVRDGKIVQMQAYSNPEEARKAVGLPSQQ